MFFGPYTPAIIAAAVGLVLLAEGTLRNSSRSKFGGWVFLVIGAVFAALKPAFDFVTGAPLMPADLLAFVVGISVLAATFIIKVKPFGNELSREVQQH